MGEPVPDTWQQLTALPYCDSVLVEPKRTLFRRWCVENRGCVGSADALAKLIGPSAVCEMFDHIEALELAGGGLANQLRAAMSKFRNPHWGVRWVDAIVAAENALRIWTRCAPPSTCAQNN